MSIGRLSSEWGELLYEMCPTQGNPSSSSSWSWCGWGVVALTDHQGPPLHIPTYFWLLPLSCFFIPEELTHAAHSCSQVRGVAMVTHVLPELDKEMIYDLIRNITITITHFSNEWLDVLTVLVTSDLSDWLVEWICEGLIASLCVSSHRIKFSRVLLTAGTKDDIIESGDLIR